MRSVLAPIYKLLELSGAYALNQRIGKPTTDRFRRLVARNVSMPHAGRILDLGCGIGNYRDSFIGDYYGIDIHAEYIEQARTRLNGRFAVMDCTKLNFSDGFFDNVVTIATTHHLDDVQFVQMVQESLRVCTSAGRLHVVDAILPVTPSFVFKRLWFSMDRGAFPRRLEHMLQLAEAAGFVTHHEINPGPLHDTAYIQIARRSRG